MVVYYASSEHTSSELYHHGIKGMHWHERRFQNKDGSLTAAGRIRYGVGKAGSGLAKLAKGAGSLSVKAGTAIGNNVKAAANKAKGDIRAKKVKKLTATKSDLAKNYDKLTPEERQAALAKFKFQDDLKDSMKKDWDRAVNYAKLAFDAIDTAENCLSLFSEMLSTITFRKEVMRLSAVRGFTNATDAADYLVVKGVPFRDAHGIIGRLVLHCIDVNKSIEELSVEELKEFSPAFDEDIYDAVSLRTCVEKRLTLGAPGSEMMKKVIDIEKEWLNEQKIIQNKESF